VNNSIGGIGTIGSGGTSVGVLVTEIKSSLVSFGTSIG